MTDVSVDILEGKDAYPADLSMSCKQAVTIVDPIMSTTSAT